MDALSSQSTVAGYKAVVAAADRLPRLFPLLMTAAGTVAPAKVLVLGAGVAGLQAIATARRLGAVVSGFDVRPAVREQVESLGASFLDLGIQGAETSGGYAAELTPEEQARQQAALEERIPEYDVVVTTALVPGRPAPKLIPAAAVEKMRPGSVIVDLAAETGGNCELTEPGSEVERHGVTIVGFTDFPSRTPYHASQLYSRNVIALLLHLARRRARARLRRRDHRRRLRHAPESHRVDERDPGLRADDPRAGDLPRDRGDLEGADDAAHAADVGDERDPRDRHRRRDPRPRQGGRRHADARRRLLSPSCSAPPTSSAASSSRTGCSRCSSSGDRRSRSE